MIREEQTTVVVSIFRVELALIQRDVLPSRPLEWPNLILYDPLLDVINYVRHLHSSSLKKLELLKAGGMRISSKCVSAISFEASGTFL